MMEVYQANADYYDMMELMEEMVAHVAENTLGSTKINYQGKDIDLTPPWRRLTMAEAVKEYTGIDFNQIESDREAVEAARSIGLEVPSNTSKGRVLNNIFEEKVEGNLIQPTFIMNYPIEISPLAAKMEEDPMFTYRFEAFINGWEMCNALLS